MQESIQGTFHFHSTYSHDGRSTLPEIASSLRAQGFSFCIMTDHFEDFDASKLERYIQETSEVSQNTGFLLIPGIEIHLFGLDTILFPVREFGELERLALKGKEPASRLFKVLAHPSKYPWDRVVNHLERFDINGFELWNQQVDGAHLPPFRLLQMVRTLSRRNQYRYLFGCDIHNVKLTVANVISVRRPIKPGAESIINELIEGNFECRNWPTSIEYRNGSDRTSFDTWLDALSRRSYRRGKFLRSVRVSLRSCYKILPRDMRRLLIDVKNHVRNKV
jgi:hypothetical protein